MVLIVDAISRLKQELLKNTQEVDCCLYNYINNIQNVISFNEPTNYKELALCGYSNKNIEDEVINNILSKPAVKNMDYRSNIFELLGIFLLNPKNPELLKALEDKFQKTTFENKYLICKIYPAMREKLLIESKNNSDNKAIIINGILDNKIEWSNEYVQFIINANSIGELIMLEDLYSELLMLDVKDLGEPKDVIVKILNEFPNAIKKITQERRKNHSSFVVKDEYDVQDLLYVILKSIYPKMLSEENTPQTGGKTERADFIFKEFEIVLEIKMIKEKDTDEKEFIKQIKIDIESYYRSNPRYMIFFIYDPENKTKDKNNFYDLQGITEKTDDTGSYKFEVITILKN